jgi:hypothetical protein
MNPDVKETGAKGTTRLIRFGGFGQRTPSQSLFLVRLAVVTVIIAAIALVVFFIWGLATHPSSDGLGFDVEF